MPPPQQNTVDAAGTAGKPAHQQSGLRPSRRAERANTAANTQPSLKPSSPASTSAAAGHTATTATTFTRAPTAGASNGAAPSRTDPAGSTLNDAFQVVAASLPTVAKAAALLLVVKGCVSFYHHYQHLKAEREVAELRKIFARQPMLIMAGKPAVGEATAPGTGSPITVGSACETKTSSEGGLSLHPVDLSAAPSFHRSQPENNRNDSPVPSQPGSALHARSNLSSIRVLSVRTPHPGQWRSVPEDERISAYNNVEKVLGRVHLFMQPRWALAPNLSPDATLLEAFMRLHKIPYTVHIVNVLHGGTGGVDDGGRRGRRYGSASPTVGSPLRYRSGSRAASWDPDQDPTGEYSGLTEEEILAEQVRRVHARVFMASRRQSTMGSSADTGSTLVGKLLLLLRSVQQTPGHRLPFIVYRGELVEGDPATLIAFLNEKFHIPSDNVLLREDEAASSLAQALRHTIDHTLPSEYGIGFLQDGPGVFCQYASQAMGPVASPWAMRAWLSLPWIGSPLRGDVKRTVAAAELSHLPRQQRQEQVLREIVSLESLLRAESRANDAEESYARPYLLGNAPTTLDCGLYAHLLPIMRLTEADVTAMRNTVFSYVYHSPVLRDYVARLSAQAFPDLELMVATVTGVPLAIPYDRDRVASRVARRRRRPHSSSSHPPQQQQQSPSYAQFYPVTTHSSANDYQTTSFYTNDGTTSAHTPDNALDPLTPPHEVRGDVGRHVPAGSSSSADAGGGEPSPTSAPDAHVGEAVHDALKEVREDADVATEALAPVVPAASLPSTSTTAAAMTQATPTERTPPPLTGFAPPGADAAAEEADNDSTLPPAVAPAPQHPRQPSPQPQAPPYPHEDENHTVSSSLKEPPHKPSVVAVKTGTGLTSSRSRNTSVASTSPGATAAGSTTTSLAASTQKPRGKVGAAVKAVVRAPVGATKAGSVPSVSSSGRTATSTAGNGRASVGGTVKTKKAPSAGATATTGPKTKPSPSRP